MWGGGTPSDIVCLPSTCCFLMQIANWAEPRDRKMEINGLRLIKTPESKIEIVLMDPIFLRCLVSSQWQEKCDIHTICVCCKRHFCVMTLMHFLIISHQKSANYSTTVLSNRLNVENWDWSCEWNKFNQQWTLKLMNGTQFRDKLKLLTLFKWGLIRWIIIIVILSIKCSATRLSPVDWLEV